MMIKKFRQCFQYKPMLWSSYLVGFLLFTACSPGAVPTPTLAAPPPTLTLPTPSQTASASTIEGTYTVTFTKEELAKAGVTAHELCENAGTHEITFSADDWRWKQTPPEDCGNINPATGRGSWELSGDEITLNEPAAFGCGALSTYKWNLDQNTLTFTVVEDSCPYRVILLTTHPWEKIQ